MSCKICGEPYNPALFYNKMKSRCKECHKAAMIKRSRENPAVQQYDRERAKLPHRREKARKAVANWRKKFPDKYTALNALSNAVRDKIVAKGKRCADCGSTDNVFAIHPDYSKKLTIVWRCALCHHRGRFAAEEARTGA